MCFCRLIEAYSESPELMEPSDRALDDPTVTSEAFAALDAEACHARDDASCAAGHLDLATAVGLVGVDLLRTTARSPAPARDVGNCVERRFEHPRVVNVRRAQRDAERDPVAIDHDVVLRARFSAVRRVRARFGAPPFAGTLEPSSEARSQSI